VMRQKSMLVDRLMSNQLIKLLENSWNVAVLVSTALNQGVSLSEVEGFSLPTVH